MSRIGIIKWILKFFSKILHSQFKYATWPASPFNKFLKKMFLLSGIISMFKKWNLCVFFDFYTLLNNLLRKHTHICLNNSKPNSCNQQWKTEIFLIFSYRAPHKRKDFRDEVYWGIFHTTNNSLHLKTRFFL